MIVDLMMAEGLALKMETNGTLLTPETVFYQKDQISLYFVSVSLDSDDAATIGRICHVF